MGAYIKMTIYPVDTPFTSVIEGPIANKGWNRPTYPPQPMKSLDSMQQRMFVTFSVAVVMVLALVMVALRLKPTADTAPPITDNGSETAAAPAAAPPQTVVSNLSPIFTPEVDYWAEEIARWSAAHGITDPNLVAIIMQIESCGYQDALSSAGAMGLFQVMPFHFQAGENGIEPETNAYRGMLFFADLLGQTGNVGLAFAGYNGGPGVTVREWESWPHETQRYYRWATGLYEDIQNGLTTSPTLQSWLEAGGSHLCQQAAARQADSSFSN